MLPGTLVIAPVAIARCYDDIGPADLSPTDVLIREFCAFRFSRAFTIRRSSDLDLRLQLRKSLVNCQAARAWDAPIGQDRSRSH